MLGNLLMAPEAGIVVPDFKMSDVLYIIIRGKILVGRDTAELILRLNFIIKFNIIKACFM